MQNKNELYASRRVKYEECLAKLMLEENFPERYEALKLEDKPDIQGERVGIEVTYALDERMQEAFGNWIKAVRCSEDEKKRYHIERMEQLGIEYTGGIQAWPGRVPTFRYIRTSTEKKLNLIRKGGYKSFENYELFIFADMWITENVINEAKEFFFSDQVSECFRTVYVLSEGTELHVFDTNKKQYNCLYLKSEEQTDRCRRATLMVKNMEKD